MDPRVACTHLLIYPRGHWAIGVVLKILSFGTKGVPRTYLAHVRLGHAFGLVFVYNPQCIKRDGVLCVLDERCGAACPESGVQCSGLATKVRHVPGDLAGKLVAHT